MNPVSWVRRITTSPGLASSPVFASAAEAGAAQASATRAAVTDAAVVALPRVARPSAWAVSVLQTARPRQWPKNLLVFAAPLAASTLGRRDWLGYALVAVAAFVFASAAVYFINDVVDVERDRRHPRKRFRPVASGRLPVRHAVAVGVLLAAVGLSAGVAFSVPLLTAAVGAYLCMSFLYSWVLKHIPVVELVFLASGFLLRVLGGAAATHVPPSGWFLLVCSLGALGVAIGKRYTELAGLGEAAIQHRPVMRWYRPRALLVGQWVIGALMIAAYVAWAAGQRPSAQAWHLLSAVPLAAALVRFGVLTARRTSAPVEDLLMKDGLMLACEVTWLALFVIGLGI
jgi:decaprenyl-phosphate phosphoribosyltransferase